jgi:hypothetical protein
VRELYEILQTQYADDGDTRPMSERSGPEHGKTANLQESTQKHEHDTKFAPAIHGQILELPHWQKNDDQVEDNIGGSGAPSVRVEVDALSVVLTIPVFPSNSDGNALQRSRYDKGEQICNAEPNCEPDDLSKSPMREDTEVKEQDRNLCQCDGRQVQKLGEIKDLESQSSLVSIW